MIQGQVAQREVFRGTVEEFLCRSEEFARMQSTVIVAVPEQEVPQQGISPNEGMLSALREIAARQKGRRHTDGSDTDRMLREGRAGAMWGEEPTVQLLTV